MSQRVRLVVNPSARSGRGAKAIDRFVAGISDTAIIERIDSRSPSHFRELLADCRTSECDIVAIAGGDGTVAMAIDAMTHDIPLAIVPTGSGNDFARDLGIATLADAERVIRHGTPARIDVGLATWSIKKRRFACVASVGLDALALKIIHGSRWPRSKALNIVTTLWALCRYRPAMIRVVWEGGSFEGEIMFVAVTNTRGYGGGFLVSPEASVRDGKLNICIVRRSGRLRLLRAFPRILRGTHGTLDEVIQATSSWVRIEGIYGEVPVAIDGELPDAVTPIELRCDAGAVSVLTESPELASRAP